MSSRLCLVRVKAFPENILFSGKENVFMCLVVFQKIFRKIFSGVWKMLQGKRQNQKNKHSTQIDARRSTGLDDAVLRELRSDDRAVDRDLAKHRAALRDRDRRRDLAKRRSRSAQRRDRNQRCDLAKHHADRDRREGEFAISNRDRRRWCLRTARTGYASPSRALALSLSLSLSLEFIRSENRNGNSFP